MPDFSFKMYQIQCRLGLRPRPRWGAYSAPPDRWIWGRGGKIKGGEGKRKGKMENDDPQCPLVKILDLPLLSTVTRRNWTKVVDGVRTMP